MPYFERSVETEPYWCPNCKAYFRAKSLFSLTDIWACAINHKPGSCCHLHEERVKPIQREAQTWEWGLDE